MHTFEYITFSGFTLVTLSKFKFQFLLKISFVCAKVNLEFYCVGCCSLRNLKIYCQLTNTVDTISQMTCAVSNMSRIFLYVRWRIDCDIYSVLAKASCTGMNPDQHFSTFISIKFKIHFYIPTTEIFRAIQALHLIIFFHKMINICRIRKKFAAKQYLQQKW